MTGQINSGTFIYTIEYYPGNTRRLMPAGGGARQGGGRRQSQRLHVVWFHLHLILRLQNDRNEDAMNGCQGLKTEKKRAGEK